jgi:hypothetical protein
MGHNIYIVGRSRQREVTSLLQEMSIGMKIIIVVQALPTLIGSNLYSWLEMTCGCLAVLSFQLVCDNLHYVPKLSGRGCVQWTLKT